MIARSRSAIALATGDTRRAGAGAASIASSSRSICSTSSTRGSRRGIRGVAIEPHGAPAAPPRGSGGCQRLGVRWAAGKANADDGPLARDLDRGAALEADRRAIRTSRDRPVLEVVQGPDRLVVRREVAARVVRAPPED